MNLIERKKYIILIYNDKDNTREYYIASYKDMTCNVYYRFSLEGGIWNDQFLYMSKDVFVFQGDLKYMVRKWI